MGSTPRPRSWEEFREADDSGSHILVQDSLATLPSMRKFMEQVSGDEILPGQQKGYVEIRQRSSTCRRDDCRLGALERIEQAPLHARCSQIFFLVSGNKVNGMTPLLVRPKLSTHKTLGPIGCLGIPGCRASTHLALLGSFSWPLETISRHREWIRRHADNTSWSERSPQLR